MGSPLQIVGNVPPMPARRPDRDVKAREARERTEIELNGPLDRRIPSGRVTLPDELPDPEVVDLRKRGERIVGNAQVRPTIK